MIPSRWVTTRKTPTTVRARIVVKDIAGKNSESARALGISSPTPSADALFTVLGIVPAVGVALLLVEMCRMLSWLRP